jgi:Na+/proline symporter
MSTELSTGAVGRPRGIGFGILLFVVTLGFYGWYWAYQTHEEMKQETGDGVGGVIGLVIWILLNFVSAFVIPSEVGKMYRKSGRESPVTGWTGLWLYPGIVLVIPAIVWFVKVQGALNRYWEDRAAALAA